MNDIDWNLLNWQVLGFITYTAPPVKISGAHYLGENHDESHGSFVCYVYKFLANNKVHLMKRLYNLKMAKCMLIAQHLIDFNTIAYHLSSAKIEFDKRFKHWTY